MEHFSHHQNIKTTCSCVVWCGVARAGRQGDEVYIAFVQDMVNIHQSLFLDTTNMKQLSTQGNTQAYIYGTWLYVLLQGTVPYRLSW